MFEQIRETGIIKSARNTIPENTQRIINNRCEKMSKI